MKKKGIYIIHRSSGALCHQHYNIASKYYNLLPKHLGHGGSTFENISTSKQQLTV